MRISYLDARTFFMKHRTVIFIVTFLFWILFISQYSFLRYRNLKQEANDLEKAIEFYKAEHVKHKNQLDLMENDSFLEKYAREKYQMKAADEDVFIFEEESEQ